MDTITILLDEHYQSSHDDTQQLPPITDIGPTEDQANSIDVIQLSLHPGNTSEPVTCRSIPRSLLPKPKQTKPADDVYEITQGASVQDLTSPPSFQGTSHQTSTDLQHTESTPPYPSPGEKRRRNHEDHSVYELSTKTKPSLQDAEKHRETFTFDTTNLYFPSNYCLQPFAQSQKFPLTGIGSWSNCTSSYPTPTASPKLGTTKDRPKEPRQILPAKPGVEPSRPKKRSRQSSLRVDGTKQPVDDNEPKPPSLACPFYKRNQKKYQDCLKYELRRPKDVKQHIFRRHLRPEFYCARCFKTFSAAEDRDHHTRELQCERVDDPQFDGISSKQQKLLKDYISQNRTVEQQWFDMWCIIFPDQTQMQPTSCYSGNHVEETVSQLRAFWDRKKSEILRSILSENEFKALKPCLIDKVISTILTRVESEMSRSAVEIAPKIPLAIPPTSTQHVQEVNVKCNQSQENDASDEDQNLQLGKELFGEMVCLPSEDDEDLPMKW